MYFIGPCKIVTQIQQMIWHHRIFNRKRQWNIWHIILIQKNKSRKYSDPLQLEASKKPKSNQKINALNLSIKELVEYYYVYWQIYCISLKLQMFHNYILNWLIVFITKLAQLLFLIISQRDTYLYFFIAGAFLLSDVSLMTEEEKEIFL